MDKIFKISSNQADPNPTLIDFDIPQGDVLDLSKSYVNLICKVDSSDAGNDPDGVYNLSIVVNKGNNNSNAYMPAVSVVKNAILTGSRAGRLEEIRDCNILRVNQQLVERSMNEKSQDSLNNFVSNGEYNEYGWGSTSPMIQSSSNEDTNNSDLVKASYLDKEVRIPMKDIFNLGNVNMLDTDRTGSLRVHMELDKSRLSIGNVSENNRIGWYSTANQGACDDNDTVGAVTTLVLTKTFERHATEWNQMCGFYVGQPIITKAAVTCKLNDTALAATKVRVVDLSYDAATFKVTLHLSGSLGTVNAGKKLEGVVVTPDDATNPTFEMSRCEVVLRAKTNVNKSDLPSSYNYTTFTSERDNAGNSATLKRQYEVEQKAVNCVMVLQKHSDSLYSDQQITSYRVAVDNEQGTNRDIFEDSPLYYDRLSKYYLNQGKEVKSLVQGLCGINDNITDNESSVVSVISQPLPITDRMKLVEFEVTSGTNMNNLILYKEVQASF